MNPAGYQSPWMDDDLRLYRAAIRQFIRERFLPNQARWRDARCPDREAWTEAGAVGLLLADVPEQYGGGGGTFAHEAVAAEELARAGVPFARLNQSIVAHYILTYGTEPQKQQWLPRLARGELVAAIAMTEPGAGSDLLGITTSARRDGAEYVINGSKTFITNGSLADLVCLAVKTEPDSRTSRSLSLVIVETANLRGYRAGRPLEKIGLHGQDTCELFFDDVRVPVANLLGATEGQGFLQMMEQLPFERLSIAVAAVAVAEEAIAITTDHAKARRAFGGALTDLQHVRFTLAECQTDTRVGRVFLDDCIVRHLAGDLDPAAVAMAKYWLTECQGRVVDQCLQLHGGYGYMAESAIGRMWADSRVQRIYAGANEVMKELIAGALVAAGDGGRATDGPAVRVTEAAPASDARSAREARVIEAGGSRQSSGEHRALVVDFNRSEAAYPSDATITDLFAAQVARAPEEEAIRQHDRSLTYRQLDARANQLARHLQATGVEPDQPVVLFMERSIEAVCALLGILKAGAAYVPIDAETPTDRLARILEDVAAGSGRTPVFITQPGLASRAPDIAVHAVVLNGDLDVVTGVADTPPPRRASSRNLAYVIYTSGSTGVPKGVMIEHRSLVNYICWANAQYSGGERLTWPLFSSLAFDLTVTSIFAPLLSGGRIVVYGEDTGAHAGVILEVVRDGVADIVKLTPSHLAMIRDRDLRATRIRAFVVGGEEFPTELAREVTARMGRPVAIYNEYGPTEATVGCMVHRYDESVDDGRSVPVGRPAANALVYILDGQLAPVPAGAVGEMYLGGDGLARGYFNRPELTARTFVTTRDPRDTSGSEETPRARLYKTGDLARWDEAGRMQFLGRADDQVKIRGFRIELGEIEATLIAHPGVRQAAVIARDDLPGATALVAYLVIEPAAPVATAALREHLRRALPDYMTPRFFVTLAALPLTSNGKVDRRNLPRPEEGDDPGAATSVVGPRTPFEERVTAIFAELLRVPQIDVHADFFERGGDSLLAMRLAARLEGAFGIELPLRLLFESPTVASLSEVIEAASLETVPADVPPSLARRERRPVRRPRP